MAIHPTDVEIFQSGSKWWTDHPQSPSASMAKTSFQTVTQQEESVLSILSVTQPEEGNLNVWQHSGSMITTATAARFL